MKRGAEIARGKTKILYESVDRPECAIVVQMDAITAGDGARRNEIIGKGRLASLTTSRVFRLLNSRDLPTHYVSGGEDAEANEMVVRRCEMIPLEVVVRGTVAGSYAKRHPLLRRGAPLDPRVLEFFLKDDANHDPQIQPEEMLARGIVSPHELATMSGLARRTFDILEEAWRRRNVLLVDLKVEFGRLASGDRKGEIVVADVIDNDSWRIWPHGHEEEMLDKQMYRNLSHVDDEALARVRRAYEEVAEAVAGFVHG